jgi:hypothetical protein
MDAIAVKHAGLVSRLTELYDIFIAMRYVFPGDVIRPPHSSRTIAIDTFRELDFEPEVIDLIKLIPALRSNVVWGWQWFGIELLPRSKAVTYLADCDDSDWINNLRWGDRVHREVDKLLPTWMLRLTSGGVYSGQYGLDLIYDTRDRTFPAFKHDQRSS